jgi:hypothetical protein
MWCVWCGVCDVVCGCGVCGVVWCGVVWCGVVWCGVVWCGVVWCGVVWCGVVWCGVVWCGVVWCGVALCANVLDCFDAFTAKEQVSLVIYCFSSVSLSVSLPVHACDCQVCLYAALLALYSRSMLRLSLVNQSARSHITCYFPRSIGVLFLISIVQICCLSDSNMS